MACASADAEVLCFIFMFFFIPPPPSSFLVKIKIKLPALAEGETKTIVSNLSLCYMNYFYVIRIRWLLTASRQIGYKSWAIMAICLPYGDLERVGKRLWQWPPCLETWQWKAMGELGGERRLRWGCGGGMGYYCTLWGTSEVSLIPTLRSLTLLRWQTVCYYLWERMAELQHDHTGDNAFSVAKATDTLAVSGFPLFTAVKETAHCTMLKNTISMEAVILPAVLAFHRLVLFFMSRSFSVFHCYF